MLRMNICVSKGHVHIAGKISSSLSSNLTDSGIHIASLWLGSPCSINCPASHAFGIANQLKCIMQLTHRKQSGCIVSSISAAFSELNIGWETNSWFIRPSTLANKRLFLVHRKFRGNEACLGTAISRQTCLVFWYHCFWQVWLSVMTHCCWPVYQQTGQSKFSTYGHWTWWQCSSYPSGHPVLNGFSRYCPAHHHGPDEWSPGCAHRQWNICHWLTVALAECLVQQASALEIVHKCNFHSLVHWVPQCKPESRKQWE